MQKQNNANNHWESEQFRAANCVHSTRQLLKTESTEPSKPAKPTRKNRKAADADIYLRRSVENDAGQKIRQ